VSDDFQRVISEDVKNGIPAKYLALAAKLGEYLNDETSAT